MQASINRLTSVSSDSQTETGAYWKCLKQSYQGPIIPCDAQRLDTSEGQRGLLISSRCIVAGPGVMDGDGVCSSECLAVMQVVYARLHMDTDRYVCATIMPKSVC